MNKQKKSEYCRAYYLEHRDEIRAKVKTYKQLNQDKIRQANAAWRLRNKVKITEQCAKWYADNRLTVLQSGKTPEVRIKVNKYIKHKYRTDPQFRLKKLLHIRLKRVIANQSSSAAIKLLGCSIDYFMGYFAGQFKSGMTWDHYFSGQIHMDHIKPLSLFDLTDPKQLVKACHYTNLQPLWAIDNLKKGAKYGRS